MRSKVYSNYFLSKLTNLEQQITWIFTEAMDVEFQIKVIYLQGCYKKASLHASRWREGSEFLLIKINMSVKTIFNFIYVVYLYS